MCPRSKSLAISWPLRTESSDAANADAQIHITARTMFNESHPGCWKHGLWPCCCYCEAGGGASAACQVQRTLRDALPDGMVSLPWGRRGNELMQTNLCSAAQIEMDETYVGGKGTGLGRRGRGTKKRPVIGIRQRNGELRLFHAQDVTGRSLEKFLRENVGEDVDVFFTDEFNAYRGIAKRRGFKHEVVQHGTKEYVRGRAHTNTIESAFSLFKRGLRGSWHKLSAKHLQAYLEEMCFRFNRRQRPDLFLDTLRHMVTAPVLTFEKLTA